MSGSCNTCKNRSCNTCKYRRLFEDGYDRGMEGGGRRLIFRCEAKEVPILATVVEKESSPEMKLETGCLSTFCCNRYEENQTEEGEENGS